MADYRDWCGSCGQEINFGSHSKGCAFVAKQREALREQNEWEDQFWSDNRDKTEDELYDELVEALNIHRALSDGMHANGKKLDSLRTVVYNNHSWSRMAQRLRESGLRFPL